MNKLVRWATIAIESLGATLALWIWLRILIALDVTFAEALRALLETLV